MGVFISSVSLRGVSTVVHAATVLIDGVQLRTNCLLHCPFLSPFLSSIVAGGEDMEEGELADDDEDNTQSSVPQTPSSSQPPPSSSSLPPTRLSLYIPQSAYTCIHCSYTLAPVLYSHCIYDSSSSVYLRILYVYNLGLLQ